MAKLSTLLQNISSSFNRMLVRVRVHPHIFIALELIFVALGLYLYWHLPGPGIAVAILGFVAAVVTIQGTITDAQKILWMIAVFILLVVEMRSINKERKDVAQGQANARAREEANFREIAGGIQGAIASSNDQFQATMGRLQTALETSKETLKNTQPRAILETKMIDPPSVASIVPGARLTLNVHYTNYGPDVAREATNGAMSYVRKPDDINAQKEIAAAFDKMWTETKHPVVVNVNFMQPRVFSFTSDKLSEAEVKGLIDHTLTIYILTRYTWMDTTGNWINDQCISIQDPTSLSTFGHTCKYHENHHYRSKPHDEY